MLDVVAWLLVVLMVVDWIAAIVLLIGDRTHPGIKALRERAVAQVALAIAATLFGVLALNRLFALGLPTEIVASALVIATVLVSLPGLLWLWRFLRNEF